MLLERVSPDVSGNLSQKNNHGAGSEVGMVDPDQPRLHLVENALAAAGLEYPNQEDTSGETTPSADKPPSLARETVDRMMELKKSLGGRAAGRSIRI